MSSPKSDIFFEIAIEAQERARHLPPSSLDAAALGLDLPSVSSIV
jgi:hypothetical protein